MTFLLVEFDSQYAVDCYLSCLVVLFDHRSSFECLEVQRVQSEIRLSERFAVDTPLLSMTTNLKAESTHTSAIFSDAHNSLQIQSKFC